MINNKGIDLILISRKEIYRNGRRYTSRGADLHGNASNTVEIEQILATQDKSDIRISSYVHMRGSVPLRWAQPRSLSCTLPLIIDNEHSREACTKHYECLLADYNSIVLH